MKRTEHHVEVPQSTIHDGSREEVQARLLFKEGKILSLQFDRALTNLDLTIPQALQLGRLLLENAAIIDQ